jgi:DNA-binding MarR family transcriptional regulator
MAEIGEEIKSQFMNERHRFITNVIYTANWIQARFTEQLKPFDLSSQQFNILRILRGAKDWVSMSEVKERMIERASNATRLSDKLLDKGLVDRQRGEEDKRVIYLHITQKGLGLLAELDKAFENPDWQVGLEVTEEEATVANKVVEKLRR